jgi:hypothetical protein
VLCRAANLGGADPLPGDAYPLPIGFVCNLLQFICRRSP